MTLETFIGGTPPIERKAFKFGLQKINLHIKGKEFEPKAQGPTLGSLDLCVISTLPLQAIVDRIGECQWPIIEGPVMRTGATGRIRLRFRSSLDTDRCHLSPFSA